MSKTKRKRIADPFENGEWIDRAIEQAILDAICDHKRAGNPIAVWRDGKVVIIPPEEIEIQDEDEVALSD